MTDGHRRSRRAILTAPLQGRHYTAAINMLRVYPRPWNEFGRYAFRRGVYPYECRVRTPIGIRSIGLDTPDDLLTVNEIFCRLDYRTPKKGRVVVDLGANIGISALYFLTRRPDARVWLFEPDARNVARLRETLRGLEGRFVLHQAAVSDVAGRVTFGIEATGRYGGIGLESATTIQVDCRHINDVLATVIEEEGVIDVLKIDTEGAEIATLRAISPDLARRIGAIVVEMPATDERLLDGQFVRRRRGGVETFLRG